MMDEFNRLFAAYLRGEIDDEWQERMVSCALEIRIQDRRIAERYFQVERELAAYRMMYGELAEVVREAHREDVEQ